MQTVEQVQVVIDRLKADGVPLSDAVWETALACVGYPYVFGAWGEECTPSNRRRRARDDHPTVVSKCQVLSGKKSACNGCKWYPDGCRVRMFDCRGFTYWVLQQVGITISGQGATSQYNTKANWVERGKIADMPKDKVCCVFVQKGTTMQHTGLYLGDGSTVECSAGVQYFNPIKAKWTHYAIPAGLYDGGDEPVPEPTKPTLRRGDAGPYVTLAQTELMQRGYDLGSYGADGKFGSATEKAVKLFQRDWDLTVDGVIGPKTWQMLDSTPVKVTYKVTVPGLSLHDAEALAALYPGSQIIKEG